MTDSKIFALSEILTVRARDLVLSIETLEKEGLTGLALDMLKAQLSAVQDVRSDINKLTSEV